MTHPAPPADRLPALEARLIDLEVRSAYQERTIEALDAVVRDFTARVERLESELETLRHSGAPTPINPPSEDDFSPF